MRILIVEDDYVSQEKLKVLLKKRGACDVAEDGDMALDMFEKAHGEANPYDLITMDIDMPGMDGNETNEKIRKWEQEHNIEFPNSVDILMITYKTEPKTIIKSFSKGGEWYLIKPFNLEKLESALEKLKELKNV